MTIKNKRKILIDFDGVINNYKGEYNEHDSLQLADGAYDFIKELAEEYRVVIFTSRNLLQTSQWIIENKLDEFVENVTNIKEPSYLIIDDRCINFNGNFEE